MESFTFGMMSPTRTGLAPAATFITLATSWSASTGEITRVRLRSGSCPLRIASLGEGRKISMTRSFSPAIGEPDGEFFVLFEGLLHAMNLAEDQGAEVVRLGGGAGSVRGGGKEGFLG